MTNQNIPDILRKPSVSKGVNTKRQTFSGTSYGQSIGLGTSHGFSNSGVSVGRSVSHGISTNFDYLMSPIKIKGYRFFPKNWSYKQYGYKEGMIIVDDDSIIKCSPYHYFLGNCISFYQDIFDCFENMEEDEILAEVESCGFAVTVDDKVYTNRLLIIKEISLTDFWNLEHK